MLSGATNNIPTSPTAVCEYPLKLIFTSVINVVKPATVNVIGYTDAGELSLIMIFV